jgi:hypothetical protein
MKKALCLMVVFVFMVSIMGCGNNKVIDGKEKQTVGVVNIIVNDSSLMEIKDPNVQYKIIWGNVVWAVILCETVVMPIYFIGFSMFEPVGKK